MSRVNYLNVYTPTYTRRLHSYANSGFFARELDADDHAFIEGIRERGCIDVPMSGDELVKRSALLEEMEFWTNPWGVEPHVEHRRGIDMIQQHRAEVELSRALYRAHLTSTRAMRAADKAMAEAELERERKEWEENKKRVEEERARRLASELQATIEWERDAPPEPRDYFRDSPRPIDQSSYWTAQREFTQRRARQARHYVPEWKRLEREAERMAEYYARNVARWRRAAKLSLKTWRRRAADQARRTAEAAALARKQAAKKGWATRLAQAERDELARQVVARAELPAPPRQMPGWQAQAEREARKRRADEEEWQRLENLRNHEARQRIGVCQPGTCKAAKCCPPGECQRSLPPAAPRTLEPWLAAAAEQLKRNICTHVNGSWPREWTVDQLMAATRCADREFLIRCCNEIVAEGRMRSKP
jgi:hypothetical protein